MRRAPAAVRRHRAFAATTGALLLAATLAACSSGENSSSVGPVMGSRTESDSRAAGGSAARPAPSPAAGSRDGTSTAARILPVQREVVYRGAISVRVKDVGEAADRVEALVLGVAGIVSAQQVSTDPREPAYGEASMTVRVPPATFGATLDAVGRLGRELDRSRSAEDVTAQVVDTDARLRSQQRSVDRVRVLLSRARTIGEVVQVESELARREADLESLQAQLKRLTDLTALATLQVRLVAPAPPTKPADTQLGLLAGLSDGWGAFVRVVLVTLTVLGALVPFAVAAGLLAAPLLLWRARRRTPVSPPAAPAASADG